MQSSLFHQANMLVEQVKTEMQNIQSSVLQPLEEQNNQENVPPSQVANIVQIDLQIKMMDILKSM